MVYALENFEKSANFYTVQFCDNDIAWSVVYCSQLFSHFVFLTCTLQYNKVEHSLEAAAPEFE